MEKSNTGVFKKIMKKKKLLIVTFVFGREYQGYIPIYFYSIYKHYPEYDAVVYVDRKISQTIQKSIEGIPGYGEKYKITLVDKVKNKLSSQQMKAYRWLLYDNVFGEYQYIYIGDIDIYICKEGVPLHEQHIRHMRSQKLVYSNIVRNCSHVPAILERWQDKLTAKGISLSITDIYYRFFYHKRLSGLHFVDSEKYYRAISRQRKKFFRVYYEAGFASRLYSLIMRSYSNEALLYYLVAKSHLRLPKQATERGNKLLCEDMESYEFRPHHGLHFGMWRNRQKADPVFDQYIATQLCQGFYRQFKEELEQEAVLKKIIQTSPDKVKRVIRNMISDFESRLK